MSRSPSNSNNSSITNKKASILPPNSNITPPPLYKKHLQPSSPPPSATTKQLNLFERVLCRRRKELHRFSLSVHQSLYETLTSTALESSTFTTKTKQNLPITSQEITTLFSKLPSKKPSNADQYISLIEYLLIDNFHSSCDSRLNAEVRTHCLQKIKYLFLAVDTARVEHTKEEKEREEKERLEASSRENLLQETRRRMGSLLSTSASASASVNGHQQQQQQQQIERQNSQNAQNQIIILDDTPPTSPVKNTTNIAKAQDPSTSAPLSSANSGDNNAKASLVADNAKASLVAAAKASTLAKSINTTTAPPTTAVEASTSSSALAVSKPTPKSTFHFVPSTKIPPSQAYVPRYKIYESPYLPNIQTQTIRHAPLTFLPDPKAVPSNPNSHTTSSSLSHRSRCEVTINTAFISCESTIRGMKNMSIPPPPTHNVVSSIYLDGKHLGNFRKRLLKWDPYWNVICDCSKFTAKTNTTQTPTVEVGYKTSNVISTRPESSRAMGMDQTGDIPRTACHIPIQFTNMFSMSAKADSSNKQLYEQVAWGQPCQNNKSSSSKYNVQYAKGEKRMLIRALPIIPNPKYKKIRSDTHQWPKGTFAQLDSQVLYPISQRKQQQHDAKLWKGLSYVYDITENLNLNTIMYNCKNKVPISLTFCCKDTEMYALQVAICEYVCPNSLFDICMSSFSKGSIAKMDYNDGLAKAMKYFEKETLVLDSDDEDGSSSNAKNTAAGIENLTCSLICPVSMQKIETPVRGKNCKHLNCFDLRTYLHSNSKVSGGRWRCFVCEDFVSVDDLVYDGFIAQVLETHGKDINTATRDKMQLSNDGTWKLLDEASSSMKRNQKKRKIKENNGNAKRPNNGSGGGQAGGTEVIDID